jgi:hypothetical protein
MLGIDTELEQTEKASAASSSRSRGPLTAADGCAARQTPGGSIRAASKEAGRHRRDDGARAANGQQRLKSASLSHAKSNRERPGKAHE